MSVRPFVPVEGKRPSAQSNALEEMVQLTRRALSASLAASQPLLTAYRDLLVSALPDQVRRPARPCAVPETACPPYCVCQMSWKARRGESLQGTIRLTNTGRAARTFSFAAGSFQGPAGDSGVVPALNPASAELKPGEAVDVRVGVEVGESLQPGSTSSSEVKVRGLYEQCVLLKVEVEAVQTPYCDVRQGEMPMRITEHHWYSHFQCEEPCFEPVRSQEPPSQVTQPQG
jgi:hypothetical protein